MLQGLRINNPDKMASDSKAAELASRQKTAEDEEELLCWSGPKKPPQPRITYDQELKVTEPVIRLPRRIIEAGKNGQMSSKRDVAGTAKRKYSEVWNDDSVKMHDVIDLCGEVHQLENHNATGISKRNLNGGHNDDCMEIHNVIDDCVRVQKVDAPAVTRFNNMRKFNVVESAVHKGAVIDMEDEELMMWSGLSKPKPSPIQYNEPIIVTEPVMRIPRSFQQKGTAKRCSESTETNQKTSASRNENDGKRVDVEKEEGTADDCKKLLTTEREKMCS